MNTIFWKGVFSTTIEGLLICDLPPITKPPLRVKETTIDGRDGSIIEELGYSSYDKAITIGLRGNFNINKVIKYFTGEGEIIFSNEPEKVYTAKIVDQIDYNRLLRFRTAVVKFRVQPYKHKYNEAYKETPTATVSGTSIVVTNSAENNLKTFSIYGKTTQDGTPTPTTPIDIVSLCADGTIAVNVNDTTANLVVVDGLRGIPVTDKSIATYTDSSGQMWCADEIDIAHGVYIKRIAKVDGFALSRTTAKYDVYGAPIAGGAFGKDIYKSAICSHTNMYAYSVDDITHFYVDEGHAWVYVPKGTTINGMSMFVISKTPTETALNGEEIAVCKAEMAGKEIAYITNDEDAPMKVEHFKAFEVFNEGLETSKPKMVLHGRGTVEISVNGVHIFDYTFPEGETEVVIDSEKEDAYLGDVLKNRHMNGEFPVLLAGTNKIEWSGDVESIEILPRSRWL